MSKRTTRGLAAALETAIQGGALDGMGEHKISPGHLFGLLISAGSIIATLVQYGSKQPPRQFAEPELLGGPSRVFIESPVIDPLHVDVFQSYSWADSFPFFMEPLAANGIRFIQIERYRLPDDQSNSNAGIELGPEAGDRDLLVEFTLDPVENRVRQFRMKVFHPYSSGETVVQGDFERISYEASGYPGYPNMTRHFQNAGKEIHVEGRWNMVQDSVPRQFLLDGAPVRQYLAIDQGFACLELGSGNSMTLQLNESGLSKSRVLQRVKKCKEQALKAAEIASIQQVCVIEGREASKASGREWYLDAAGRIESVEDQQFDSLGRPVLFIRRANLRGDTLAVDRFLYNLRGQLLKTVREEGNVQDVHEFRYSMTGWPERMLHYQLLPNRGIHIVSRTFFKFRQH